MRVVEKITNPEVRVEAPPSKAHTLRALIMSALARGESRIYNPLLGEDQKNVIASLKALGVEIRVEKNIITVKGVDGVFSPVSGELNVGESGVGMNFLSSIACFSDKPLTVTGAEGLLKRPVKELVDGLLQLGCIIEYGGQTGFPPVRVYNQGMRGGTARIYGAKTSQYFSAITTAAPYASERTVLICADEMTEKPYYDITLQMMKMFGVDACNDRYKKIIIPSGQRYQGCDIHIEGDYSSASFFFLAAAICRVKVTVTNLLKDSRQGDKAFLDLLEKMGCEVAWNENEVCITGRPLKPLEADMGDIPDLVPPMAVAMAFAEGTSRITHIGHLRYKECDRLSVVVEELRKMGARAEYDDDSMTITGGKPLQGAVIDPHNDHRIAMSFAIAGLASGNQRIQDEKCVAKSFPDFWEKFEVFYA